MTDIKIEDVHAAELNDRDDIAICSSQAVKFVHYFIDLASILLVRQQDPFAFHLKAITLMIASIEYDH